jgi:tetratricopeptide (TPR) repeat protein
MRRQPTTWLLLATLALAMPVEARKNRTAMGEAIRAARLISALRLREAEEILVDLERNSPGEVEVKWLRGQLLFHRGDYAGVLRTIEGVSDDEQDGQIGQLRALATSTLGVTKEFVHRRSPSGNFDIYYAPGPDEIIVDLAAEVLDQARAAIGQDFAFHPQETIRVEILGSARDLSRVSPLTEADIETTGTIALSKYGKLMVVSPRATVFGYPWMDTLAHEYLHLAIAEMSQDTVPVWLQEGLARFEQTRWRLPAAGAALSAGEKLLLTTAVRAGRLISLDEMHPSLAKLPSQEAAALAYAQVFTLVSWLHGKVGYKGLRDMVLRQRDGASAGRAVAEIMGKGFVQVEQEWKVWLRTIEASGGKVVPRRIRFRAGGRDDENAGVSEVGSARARKHARLGGMLRARGLLEAAAIEYEKALAAGSEPFVAGKLARTLVELGRNQRAIELATPLLAADGEDAIAAVTLGVAHAAAGQWKNSAEAFEIALRTGPFDPTVRCGLAEAYRQLGHRAATREQLACAAVAPQVR